MINDNMHTFVVLAYKKSPYLEECVNSVINQSYKSNVIIATTTINDHIKNIAKKYKLDLIEGKHTNIGGDFDFAKNSSKTDLVTIAHQDDIYDRDYSKEAVMAYKSNKDASIIFTDYYEIREGNKVSKNKNLKIKRFLLFPIRNKKFANNTFLKRLILRFGDGISCPSVTFVKQNVPNKLFTSKYKANIDWFAWEKLSKMAGRFIYINKILMGHRISNQTETTKIINKGIRTQEDLEIFKKFWPGPIASILAKLYKKAEKSNKL